MLAHGGGQGFRNVVVAKAAFNYNGGNGGSRGTYI